jgi:hypothetical protein
MGGSKGKNFWWGGVGVDRPRRRKCGKIEDENEDEEEGWL